jgi:hypothetical protein
MMGHRGRTYGWENEVFSRNRFRYCWGKGEVKKRKTAFLRRIRRAGKRAAWLGIAKEHQEARALPD